MEGGARGYAKAKEGPAVAGAGGYSTPATDAVEWFFQNENHSTDTGVLGMNDHSRTSRPSARDDCPLDCFIVYVLCFLGSALIPMMHLKAGPAFTAFMEQHFHEMLLRFRNNSLVYDDQAELLVFFFFLMKCTGLLQGLLVWRKQTSYAMQLFFMKHVAILIISSLVSLLLPSVIGDPEVVRPADVPLRRTELVIGVNTIFGIQMLASLHYLIFFQIGVSLQVVQRKLYRFFAA